MAIISFAGKSATTSINRVALHGPTGFLALTGTGTYLIALADGLGLHSPELIGQSINPLGLKRYRLLCSG
jgi:hypothetical protein